MKLDADRLPGQLAERLLPVYLVAGDEPLLATEALDAIRARARALGFDEREQVFIDKSAATWENALASTQTQSLFASRRILEIRMPGGKPGHGAATLLKLIGAAGDDLLLLIATGRLDREAQGAEWVQAVQQRGALVNVWPVDAARFPGWLAARARAVGLALSADALSLLAVATEGNLLAAHQEIEKLRLRYGSDRNLGLTELADALGDSARYDVMRLTQAIAAGEAARALRILAGLRAEGDEPVRVLWWLVNALRRQGGPRTVPMARLIARAARVDRVAKGQSHGEAWDELALLCAEMCGRRTLPLPRFAALWERPRV
ncbi:MAG TPA: DNA polymerase III subunit delta [Steroidobacteraceae bacterium]|nr:DNA polymerase III subunit delta [Steroidobacteraceae bacterium]